MSVLPSESRFRTHKKHKNEKSLLNLVRQEASYGFGET